MVSQTPFRMAEFKSSFGPNYQYQPNVAGYSSAQALRLGLRSAAYGGALGFALIFYVSGIPRVQRDVLSKIPIVGSNFVKEEVHPADNPF